MERTAEKHDDDGQEPHSTSGSLSAEKPKRIKTSRLYDGDDEDSGDSEHDENDRKGHVKRLKKSADKQKHQDNNDSDGEDTRTSGTRSPKKSRKKTAVRRQRSDVDAPERVVKNQVLDLPLCQDSFEIEDRSPVPFALYQDSHFWSPKANRLEVNIVPRPRPSPIRPRIDPWSFISAGVADKPGVKKAVSSSSPTSPRLGYHPSPTNPFTNCDPFPSPDCDPFNLKLNPSRNSDHASGFDPFSTPFPTSRSTPCSTNASPNLSLRVAPLNPADCPLIDLGWVGVNKPLDVAKERVHPRRTLGLSPFRSPAPHRDDRF